MEYGLTKRNKKKRFLLWSGVFLLLAVSGGCYAASADRKGNSETKASIKIEESAKTEDSTKTDIAKNNTSTASEHAKEERKGAAELTQDIAKTALDSFLSSFYVKEEKGGYIVGEDFWQQAEIFELVIDAYEQTGEESYLTLMDEMYRGFLAKHGEDWSYNDFNDDIMWMTIACTRAYEATEDAKYLTIAEKHFNIVFDRAWSEDLGGGLFWKTENKTKNSCINSPAAIAACLLGKATGNREYYDKAVMIYRWEKENLFGATGAVFDAYDLKTGINQWCSTYNQGTFIGAATLLYQIYGEETYLQDAKLAADYTVNTMFSGQVMNTEGEGNDLPGFKGILARWLGKFARECDQEQYADWMKQNALAAWNNRNTNGIMWTQFNTKTDDTFYTAWGCSAAVSMLINTPYEIIE